MSYLDSQEEHDSFIGTIHTKYKHIKVIGIDRSKTKNYTKTYIIYCGVCSKDTELHGDTIFKIRKYDFNKGVTSCACSHNFKFDKRQINILIARKFYKHPYNDNLVVIGYDDSEHKSSNKKSYYIKCLKCEKDPELHNDAVYKMTMTNYLQGNVPCGCSSRPKWNKTQYEILLKRKLHNKNINFIEFQQDFNGVFTKLNLECKIHGNWNSSTIQNILNFDVECPICSKHGFDKNLDSFLYICVLFDNYSKKYLVGYGITNFPDRRLKQHQYQCARNNYEITDFIFFKANNGDQALSKETEIKSKFLSCDCPVIGFRTENTAIVNYPHILNIIQSN